MITSLRDDRPRARKAHVCAECGGLIPPGVVYVCQVNVDGSERWTYKAHEVCYQLFCAGPWNEDEPIWECGQDKLRDLLFGLMTLAGLR